MTSPTQLKTFTLLDAALTIGLPVLAGLAWTVPRVGWPVLARAIAPFQLLQITSRPDLTRARIAAMTDGYGHVTPARDVLSAVAAENVAAQMLLLSLLAPGRTPPPTRLTGEHHLHAARLAGKGTILWVGHFVHGSLMAKIVWHRSGYPVSHLSHVRHGFSSSIFGQAYLNAIVRRIEDRYLAERVIMTDDRATGPLRTLRRRLAANRLVSITARAGGRRPARVPLLNGDLTIATGAPDLAWSTGAALLPVFPVRVDDVYEIRIDRPLAAPGAATRTEWSTAIAHEYAERLSTHVLRHADQWLGWTIG